ncbi:DUF3667 domain-containing protein [Salegentibacter salegens]|jgi:hypothetical protein|uniref:DUF3667 domain-containing protein n=1 Tax=Salegentibacter salegens TaxID=143223 RepID=A0A1M7L062_9FLAO|nr:DUF3667 domain-containing protein [Salegentibacter salegens]PRX44862.1 uncharacterized protein DUF3667 [Salegentibacter salegens]SHM71300.1 Protein of unknown function [Salegentibacter salegens]
MAGSRYDLKYRGTKCLNCEIPLDKSDKYCPSCGQLNSTKKLKFDDFFSEFFSGLFAYDSRFHRTLRVLLFSPGKISKDYINGKRMRYANPFRFYLSASIIFFLIWSFTNSFENIQPIADNEEIFQELEQDSISSNAPNIIPTPVGEMNLDSIIQKQQKNSAKSYKEFYTPNEELDTMSYLDAGNIKFNIYSRFYKETTIRNAETAMDSLSYPQTNYNHWLYKKAADWNTVKDNPALFFNYFVNKLPFIIFFYLPVFALFIWLVYLRRPFNYMEHLIFSFHVQTTFFIIYALGLLLDYFLENWAFTIANTVFSFYLYKAMRNFYAQGRVKTIVKFVLLNFIFFILAGVAAIISILASFAIY